MNTDPRSVSMPLAASAESTASRAFLAIAAVFAMVFLLFWETSASMVQIWMRSETFQHCFVVVPASLWLVWEQRFKLAATAPRPFWPGLLLIVGIAFVWLLGVLGAAQVVSQIALVGMIAGVVLTVFGRSWLRVLAFPLVFLVFAVPFGEAVVPKLMEWTADFTVSALRLSGIPVYREAMHLVIPTGRWSVIEACSGIKFLIASLMTGSLYAFLMYRSAVRRAAFFGASILVPILANWLRAYFIVLIGHLSQNRMMTNEDHIVFGWVLFGAIMLLLYWQGARWREDRMAREPQPPTPEPWIGTRQLVLAAALATASLVAWPAIATVLMPPIAGDRAEIVAPEPAMGWKLAQAAPVWQPDVHSPDGSRTFVYVKDGVSVGLFVAIYRNQTQQSQVGSSANAIVNSGNRSWREVARRSVDTLALAVPAVPDRVRAAEVASFDGRQRLVVWQWYWAGDAATSNAARTKLELARTRLLRQPDAALWIAAFAPIEGSAAESEQALQAFMKEMGPSLRAAFRASVGR
jgi:exosortase A